MNRQGEIREKIRISLEKHISSSGYTQKEIAEKLGVSKSSVTNWLKGKNSPDANLVMPICNLLNISIGQFYGEDDSTGTDKSTQKAPSYSDEAMKLAQDYDEKMDDWGRKQVRDVADNEIARCSADRQARAEAVREEREQAGREAAEEIPTLSLDEKVAELERQNQEKERQLQDLAAKVAAMEEEDALLGLTDAYSASPMVSVGNIRPGERVKK